MIRPNYRDFRRAQLIRQRNSILCHSAKGSTWEEHKYIKRIDGTYYYPDNYEGGRHLPNGDGSGSGTNKDASKLEEWEKKLQDNKTDLDALLRGSGDYRATLSKYMGKDQKELSDEEIEKAKKKLLSRYNISGSEELEDWEETMYENLYQATKKEGSKLDPLELASGDKEEFKKALSEYAKVDVSNLSDEELTRMQEKAKAHYEDMKAAKTLEDSDIDKLAKEVIDGKFGDEKQQKELLGEHYEKIKERVEKKLKDETIEKLKKQVDDLAKKVDALNAQIKEKEAKAAAARKSSSSSKKKKSSGGSSDSEPSYSAPTKKAVAAVSNKKVHSGVNMNKVLAIYKRRRG